MTMRPRLSRIFSLAVLAVITLLFAYFPLGKIRAGSARATILPSAGKPLVNLKSPQAPAFTYTGDASAAAALQGGTATATALAAADFNADGAMDVVAGYSTGNGGVLVLMRGNPDAFAPTDQTLYAKAMKGKVPPTFLSKATAFSLPESPDLLVTGDFNHDGKPDVLVAARGGSLYLLAGDGRGNLQPPQIVSLPGQVRALAVNVDGHVAVSMDVSNSEELQILAPSSQGLTAAATYPLPARGDSVAWGTLGGGMDVAVGAGSNVVMIYSVLTANPQAETVKLPYQVEALAIDDYIWDRDGRKEISVLADDGTIHILQHGVLNTAPLTDADRLARRAARSAKAAKAASQLAPNPTALGAWTEAKQVPYTGSALTGPVSASAFNTPHLAGSSTADLMVIDAGQSLLHILDTSGATASPSAGISFSGTPVAALALPEKINSGRDIVVLTSSQSAPMVIATGGDPTFNVTWTSDEDDAGACTSSAVKSGTGGDGNLSLREAVCEANNNAPNASTINVPSGTFDLTSLESGELRIETSGTGYTLSIIGAGASSTIIQQTDGVDRIFEEDYATAGGNPLTLQNLTLTGGNCTNDTTNDCSLAGGGAILAGGFANDPLTLTNVVLNHNSTNQLYGGAVSFDAPNLTITNSTFSNNSTINQGGGVWFADYSPINETAVVTITNSTFTNNTSGLGATSQVDTEGGGLFLELYQPYTSVTISGSTFTGNNGASGGGGGGIFADLYGTGNPFFTVSNSRLDGNVAGGNGGSGMSIQLGAVGNIQDNWWGCNGGPGATGCDTVYVEPSVGSQGNYNPWLVLSISASPNQILPGATSTLTADLTHDSNGGSGFSVPNGVPVAFGGILGTVNPVSTTLTSGLATSTYTAGSSAGNETNVTAKVDNGTASTTIDILDSVTVATSPANLSIIVDGTTYTAPQTFNWIVGSTHALSTNSPQNVSGGSEQVFGNWSDGGAQSHTVTAPAPATTYTATFNTQYQLTTQALPSADGSVTPASGNYYPGGSTVAVTATANAGFQFTNWTSTGGSFDSTTAASTNFHMPSAAAATVTGNFVPATTQITITTNPANLLVSVDGGSAVVAPLVETWNISSSHTIATTSPQAGGAGIQYVFNNWSDGGAISHAITVPATATTYTASFATQYQLATAANPSAGGTVTPSSGNYYTSGTVVPLTATANAGYSFTNWTGNVANSTSASTSITMTAPQSVTANFSLIIVAAPTTTSVSSNNNPSFTSAPGNSVTFTATVTSTSTVNEGTVTFSDAANDFTCSGGNTVPVSNGQAACTTSFTTEGSRNVTGAYNGTVNFLTSSGFITQTVNNHTVQTGNQFCNQGAITVPSTAGAATPYPSNIFVSGLGNVGSVTVQLNGISSSDIAQTDLLLVGPTGAAIVPFASVGDSSTIGGVNITLDDSASSLIPGGSPLTSGTYKPTSITGSTTLIFPAPAPLINAGDYAATDGAATLASQFSGTAANGTWALYAMDNSGSGAATIGSGWCVNISPSTVQTTITTSPAGLLVSVDGGTATSAPLVENWVPGSTHTIATTSPQAGGTGVQYVWSNWSDSGAISHSITVPSTATTYTATFGTQYQLTTQASPPADGTVTPASGGYYASGATIPVTATANSGFTFTNWTSTGGSFDSTTASSTNFHMPATPATVTGNFGSASVQITITTTPANLLVSVDGGTATAAPLVETWVIGSSHTIATTSPQSGGTGVQYVWSNWSDSGAISHSITVPSTATTYTASFNTQYQLTTQASPPADGSVTPASGSYFAAGATIPVTATANAGFTFSNWTSTGGTFDSTTAASTNFHMPSAPATVTGNFGAATVQITITTSPANLLVSVDGGTATTAPLVETWNIGSSHSIATSSPQAGGTGVQYVWSNWSDSGAISHSITVPSTATTYTATFNTQYQLTTQASPAGDGSVTPASGGYYAAGAVVPVTATANAGFQFTNWTSTGGTFDSTTAASTNFHMPSAPATVTGNFTAINDFSIAANPTSLSLVQGASGTSTISTAVTAGSAGTVSLVVSGVPSGASATLNPTSVTAGGSSTLMVNAGTATPGTYTLTVTGMEGSKTHSATVSLTVTAAAQLSVTPTNINFGTVRQYSLLLRNVTVKNTGTSTVSISKVSVTPGTGADSDDFTPISFCKSSLAPGKSCIITVAFFADNLGTLNATLYITDNAVGSPQAVTLSGTVIKDH